VRSVTGVKYRTRVSTYSLLVRAVGCRRSAKLRSEKQTHFAIGTAIVRRQGHLFYTVSEGWGFYGQFSDPVCADIPISVKTRNPSALAAPTIARTMQ
jgi:hypothetical protein